MLFGYIASITNTTLEQKHKKMNRNKHNLLVKSMVARTIQITMLV